MTEPLNWSGELEAVHEDGRVVPVTLLPEDEYGRPHEDSTYGVNEDAVGLHNTFFIDGRNESNSGWRIRNRRPASDSLEARKDALIRRIAKQQIQDTFLAAHPANVHAARALVAEMEPPVDADLLEARRIEAQICRDTGGDDEAETVLVGGYDDRPGMKGVLAAIKRGREPQKEEQGNG